MQGRPDTRRIPINKVGIKDIYHPVRVLDRSGGEQHTIANFNMYVNLPHNFKGTHMSRFVEILNSYEKEISVTSFQQMLEDDDAPRCHFRSHRDELPVLRHETRAGVRASRACSTTSASLARRSVHDGASIISLKVVVPVTSLCPCSKRHLRLRRPQPALARDDHRSHRGLVVAGGAHRYRRAGGFRASCSES